MKKELWNFKAGSVIAHPLHLKPNTCIENGCNGLRASHAAGIALCAIPDQICRPSGLCLASTTVESVAEQLTASLSARLLPRCVCDRASTIISTQLRSRANTHSHVCKRRHIKCLGLTDARRVKLFLADGRFHMDTKSSSCLFRWLYCTPASVIVKRLPRIFGVGRGRSLDPRYASPGPIGSCRKGISLNP